VRVTDVPTRRRFAFTQANGQVTISGITNWDTYDTVFRVDLAGRDDLYSNVTATATASADGTFWDDNEPRRMGISERTATQMGHLPITWTAGPLSRLRARRRLYTHLNNTNPLVDPTAPAHASLAALGIEVAPDRTVIEL
jgi:pyrroloquinoline quinone biosynthesis protein B